jgi:GTPase SAR1 family protein
VFVVGNPSAGKSTLTAALQKEASSFFIRAFTSGRPVSEVVKQTAGVIPHEFESKKYGRITLYDFAGHREFYNSHAALLQNAVQYSPPIFLLVVDLTDENKVLKENILYWLSFLENQCTSADSKPHVVIIGSHVDVLEARGEDPKDKANIVESLRSNHFKNLEYAGFVAINCQFPESTGMTDLRLCLKNSCDQLRRQETINFSAHCLQTFLINKFQDRTALRINEVRDVLLETQQSTSSLQKVVTFIPTNIHLLCGVYNELNDRGHILFLRDLANVETSWVIMNKDVLLSKVTGTIFAPEGFDQHCQIATSTGVVSLSKIAKQFSELDPEMLVGFLSHLEFCHEIFDEEILKLIGKPEAGFPASERYFFFPALVRLDVPQETWVPEPTFKFHSGWILKCSRPEKYFTTRFVQVLLLRLAFEFAFPHHEEEEEEGHVDFPAILRKCSVWKNGIYWGNRDGVEVLAEVVEQNKAVVLLFRSCEVTPESLQLRSKVIQKALKAASEFCPKVKTVESFVDPTEIIHPPQMEATSGKTQAASTRSVPKSASELSQHQARSHVKPTSELSLFPIAEIATAIVEGKSSVLTKHGKPLQLDALLCFEPYASIGRYNLCKLFDEGHPEYDTKVPMIFPEKIPYGDRYRVIELLNPSQPKFQAATEGNDQAARLNEIFRKWRNGGDGTFHCLRRTLDQFSVFAMRNVLVSTLYMYMYMHACMSGPVYSVWLIIWKCTCGSYCLFQFAICSMCHFANEGIVECTCSCNDSCGFTLPIYHYSSTT